MAAGRGISQQLLRRRFQFQASIPAFVAPTNQEEAIRSAGVKSIKAFALFGVGVTGALSFATFTSADEAEHGLPAPSYPWPHKGILSSYDQASHGIIGRTMCLLFSGYRDPPAGFSIREGLHYNPYFPGGAIAMPKMFIDSAVEYEDGTPATEAQMGKVVVACLSWAAEPEMEERKPMGFKWIFLLPLALLQAAYYGHLNWSVVKSRKLVLDVDN